MVELTPSFNCWRIKESSTNGWALIGFLGSLVKLLETPVRCKYFLLSLSKEKIFSRLTLFFVLSVFCTATTIPETGDPPGYKTASLTRTLKFSPRLQVSIELMKMTLRLPSSSKSQKVYSKIFLQSLIISSCEAKKNFWSAIRCALPILLSPPSSSTSGRTILASSKIP